jgi:hypothetical protein
MAHKLAGLIFVGVAVLGSSHLVTSARSVPSQSTQVEILVNGSPQRRYYHEGRWYVEAIKGREYAIRLHNPYAVRAAVALSVDGLNTIDARHTDPSEARKWVLEPFQTVTISGWQTSRTDARRFEFTTEEQSYGQALGKTDNLGVISAVFFRERVATYTRDTSNDATLSGAPAAPPAAAATQRRDESRGAESATKVNEEYAATGMGRRTDHAVTQVWLDLEAAPAHAVNIRYEFREQLVRLGILPAAKASNPLDRRERARGFEAGFSPEPPQR